VHKGGENIENIYLEKSILGHRYLSDEGLAVYIALRQSKELETDYKLFEYIAYLLAGKTKVSPTLIKKIKAGICNLSDLGLIEILAETKHGVEVDVSSLYFCTEAKNKKFSPFVIIRKSEVNTIFGASEVKYPMKVLRYFCNVIGTISNGTDNLDGKYCCNVGNCSISRLAALSNISESAAIDYNTILERINLLVICRAPEGIADESGRIISGFTNCYGRPENREAIQDFQNKRIEECSVQTNTFSKNVNNNRRMMQKYNEVINGKTYSKPEIRELLNHFGKENAKYSKELTAIVNKYNLGELSEEEMNNRIDFYKKSHKKVDVTPLEALIDLSGENDHNDEYSEFDGDYLLDDEVFEEITGERNNNLLTLGLHPKRFTEDSIDEVKFASLSVRDELVSHYCNMIKNVGFSFDTIKRDLKRSHGCDEEMIEKYMKEIKKRVSEEDVKSKPWSDDDILRMLQWA